MPLVRISGREAVDLCWLSWPLSVRVDEESDLDTVVPWVRFSEVGTKDPSKETSDLLRGRLPADLLLQGISKRYINQEGTNLAFSFQEGGDGPSTEEWVEAEGESSVP